MNNQERTGKYVEYSMTIIITTTTVVFARIVGIHGRSVSHVVYCLSRRDDYCHSAAQHEAHQSSSTIPTFILGGFTSRQISFGDEVYFVRIDLGTRRHLSAGC